MKDLLGTISMGIRAPIFREGDDVAQITANCILEASKEHSIPIADRDVIALTESIVARTEGNYVTVDEVAKDVAAKFGDKKIGVIFPILSRNRFAMCFKGICRGAKGGIVLMLSLPADEVGNHLVDEAEFFKADIGNKVINEEEYRQIFGYKKHEFTGVHYVEYYRDLAEAEGCEIEIIFNNNPAAILDYTKNVLYCDIHTRFRTRHILEEHGAELLYGMDNICAEPSVEGKGCNPKYGLLGSNKADEERLKLFPKTGEEVVAKIQKIIYEETGKKVEVLVYGDGAFKDPVGKIWELADPVVSPAYTEGLKGRPNELKLKALADGKFADLNGEELKAAITESIKEKGGDLVGDMSSQGTTPRQLTDLLGSLSDLTSGSGDKGTPIVWIKGYFKTYAD